MGKRWVDQSNNHYCLKLGNDHLGDARIIEFDASGAHSALLIAGRHCRGRKADVFENGHPLCSVVSDPADGFWVIMPPVAQSVAAISR